MANKFDEEMKKFVKAYTENAKQIAERKEEIETLSTEIAEVEREDREKEAKRLAGIKRASGIDLPPNPISDPRYAAKLRQKQDLEIIKKMYANVVEIITYDDLIGRVKNTINIIKKRRCD